MQLVWEKITEFTDNFKNSISGKYDPKRAMGMNSELSGGAIIKMMFNELYEQYSDKYKATSGYTDKDIGSIYYKYHRPRGFVTSRRLYPRLSVDRCFFISN